MKYHIVTSLNSKLWNKYAHKTVGSFFAEYKDKPEENFQFMIWFDYLKEIEDFLAENPFPEYIRFTALDQFAPYVDFERKFSGDVPIKERGIKLDKIPEGSLFRWNYMPFAKKVYSWAGTYLNMDEGDILVWIDADITLTKRLDKSAFEAFLPENFDLCFLDRDFPMYAAETGFFMLRKCQAVDQFVMLMLQTYQSGFIFDLSEWHDGYVFKTILKLASGGGIRILNLNPVMKEMDVFHRTMLADFMTHWKGPMAKKKLRGDDLMGNSEDNTLIEYDQEAQGYE